jgi:nicotinamidase-related amidase
MTAFLGDDMKTALLVIDVQQGLCEGEGVAYGCAELIARINTVSAKARATGIPVIFIQHESSSGYLEYASREWQLAEGLQVSPEDLRIRKTTPDAFLKTRLLESLVELGVAQLVVCGMHSEFCVDTTTRKALALGYPVMLLADGHTSAGNVALTALQVIAHHNATLTNISSFGPRACAIRCNDIHFQ